MHARAEIARNGNTHRVSDARSATRRECGAGIAPSKMGHDARSAEIPARQDSEGNGAEEGTENNLSPIPSVFPDWKGQGGWAPKIAVAPAAVAALLQTLRAERECGEPSRLQRAGTARLTHMHQTSHPLSPCMPLSLSSLLSAVHMHILHVL